MAVAQVKAVVGETPCPPLAELLKTIEAQGIKGLSLQEAPPSDSFVIVPSTEIVNVLRFLRDDLKLQFNFLQVVSATDFVSVAATEEREEVKARMELLYVVYSFQLKATLNIKVILPRDNTEISTVSHLFRAANWYERECYDLLGVKFTNHPHLERILLPSDWEGHPLRKDYVFPETYNGMKVPL